MANCDKWNEKASRCPKAAEGFEPYHKWFTVSKQKTATSEFISTIMCGICFHEVNITEAYEHRDCIKPS
jgi:hypothetical protein